MISPIQKSIGCVFIPVNDMQKSIEWYNTLLGIDKAQLSHDDKIYTIPLQGGIVLILDSNKPVLNSSQPLFFFWTKDLKRTFQFLEEKSIEIVNDIEDIGSVSFITFKDLDNNLLMVCQKN